MQIDIPAHIEKLLFLHDTLTIPSFGTLTATKSPATADYISGTVSPPAKSLAFSENIVADDGILVNDVAVTHSISTEEAKRAVAEFVEKIQGLLIQREIVTLPNVGRLYKNYVQKIQFLPDTTNFNAESFGLPPLQFSPIVRSRELEKNPEMPVAAKTTAPPPPKPIVNEPVSSPPPVAAEPYTPAAARSGGAGWATAIGITLLLLALAGSYWLWQYQKKQSLAGETDKTELSDAPAPGSGITNAAPKKAEKPAKAEETTASIAPEEKDEMETRVQESVAEKTAAAREEAKNAGTKPKGSRECILVVATLREKTNADRLEQLLKEEGFDVYFLQRNGYQVGIQFNYTKLSEVQDKIKTLQNLTGEKDIWIKKK